MSQMIDALCERINIGDMTGKAFQKKLDKLELSQAWFARHAGVTREAVNRWCRGSRPVPRWAIWILALLGEP
jgi:DNA-binding transcriptional regulator YiaG